MTLEPELPPLTPRQLEALRLFAALEIGVEEMRRSLAGAFDFEFQAEQRTATGHFRIPEPGITVTRAHIANALEMKRVGLISERDLVHWATILLLNDAYVWEAGDEDLISEWLNDISVHLDAG